MRSLFRPILFGMLVGAAIFFVPFPFPFLLFFLFFFVLGRAFRPWRHRRFWNETVPIDGYGSNHPYARTGNEKNITIQ